MLRFGFFLALSLLLFRSEASSVVSARSSIDLAPISLDQLSEIIRLSSDNTGASFCVLHSTISKKAWLGSVKIANKTTIEKGQPGQGLLDNMHGECGTDMKNYVDQWHPESLGKNNMTGALESYYVTFTLYGSDPSCVTRAIKLAENQSVACPI